MRRKRKKKIKKEEGKDKRRKYVGFSISQKMFFICILYILMCSFVFLFLGYLCVLAHLKKYLL